MSTVAPSPEYILVAQTSLPHTAPPGSLPVNLAHPIIQYHYTDDPPFDALPVDPAERVLVLDLTSPQPTAKSLTPHLVVSRLHVSDEPGAVAVDDASAARDDKMYVIDVVSHSTRPLDESLKDAQNPHAALARFNRRNASLRAALEYLNLAPPPSAQTSPQDGEHHPSTSPQSPG